MQMQKLVVSTLKSGAHLANILTGSTLIASEISVWPNNSLVSEHDTDLLLVLPLQPFFLALSLLVSVPRKAEHRRATTCHPASKL